MKRTDGASIAARFFVGALLAASASALHAETYCTDCLETALQKNADRTYDFIKGAWDQYSQATALLKQREATGTPEQIEKARAVWRILRDNWTRAEKMAKGYASPAFVSYLHEERTRLSKRLQDEQARLKRETGLYRRLVNSTFGPQRQGVIADILGYEKESEHLKRMFKADMLSFGLRSAEYGSSEYFKHLVTGSPEGSLMAGLAQWGKAKNDATWAGFFMIREGKHLQHAFNENQQLKAYADAVGLAAEGALRFAKLVGDIPGTKLVADWGKAAAEKGPVVIAIAALAMDTYMANEAVKRLDAADKRIVDLNALEKTWQAKIATAGEELVRTRRRLAQEDREIEAQKRIAALYAQIRASQ